MDLTSRDNGDRLVFDPNTPGGKFPQESVLDLTQLPSITNTYIYTLSFTYVVISFQFYIAFKYYLLYHVHNKNNYNILPFSQRFF